MNIFFTNIFVLYNTILTFYVVSFLLFYGYSFIKKKMVFIRVKTADLTKYFYDYKLENCCFYLTYDWVHCRVTMDKVIR